MTAEKSAATTAKPALPVSNYSSPASLPAEGDECMQGRRIFGAVLAVVLLAGFATAKAQQGLPPNQHRIYVAVSDAKAAQAAPRNIESFHVWENGVVRPVVAAAPATEIPAIIVIIHGFERDETLDARKALTAFVDAVRAKSPDAKLAIIGDVQDPKLTNITANAAKLDETARRFSVSGSNLLYFEAIVDASKALGKEPTDRRIIVTLTKSTKHDADHQTTPQTIAALKKSGAAVWSIDVTPENATQVVNNHATLEMDAFVQNAASYSGGAAERIFGTASLPSVLNRFADLILGQYQITFERPDFKGETELRVGVAGVASEKVYGPGWFIR